MLSVVKCTIKIASWTRGNQIRFCKGQIHSQNCSTRVGMGGPPRGTSQAWVSWGCGPEWWSVHAWVQLPPVPSTSCFLCCFSPCQLPAPLRSSAVPPPCHSGSLWDPVAPLLYSPLLVGVWLFLCVDLRMAKTHWCVSHDRKFWCAVSFSHLWKLVMSAACLSVDRRDAGVTGEEHNLMWQATCKGWKLQLMCLGR